MIHKLQKQRELFFNKHYRQIILILPLWLGKYSMKCTICIVTFLIGPSRSIILYGLTNYK